MSMLLDDFERDCHPVDIVEQLATLYDWTFDRCADDEINISVDGAWTNYHVSINWQEDLESLHLACSFDIRVPENRQDDICRLIALINAQLWLGHFDLWTQEGALMYRHGLLFAGGSEPTTEQCKALLHTALETCERYYQSFQFVLWAGKSPQRALETSLFETIGQA
ncbi:MAG: YbjN domain-containing protein [Hyphomicrobiales bacterium]|nr:YbjN domain-containing protein [Hyphomicrobiales bacterium]